MVHNRVTVRASVENSMEYSHVLASRYLVRRSFPFQRKTLFGSKFISNLLSHNWPIERRYGCFVDGRM